MSKKHINISDLTAVVSEKSDLALKFYFDDTSINPGYHVTEVRHATIKSRDCGKNSTIEQWGEITVQLLDGSANSNQGHMLGSKFLGIVGSALKSLESDGASHLFFEYAPSNGPIRKLSVESFEIGDGEIAVSLGSEQAVCKPFQRMKEAMGVAAIGDVAAKASGGGCCAPAASSNSKGCC